MATNALDYDDWKLIIDRICDGACVPFLGAGVNVSSSSGEYQGLPLGGDLSLRMVERWMDLQGIDLEQLTKLQAHEKILASPLYEDYKDLTRMGLFNLSRVALHVQVRQDYGILIKYLRELIPEAKCQPSPLLRTLAKLPSPVKPTSPPFQLIVTTNYDRLMERALETQGYKEDKEDDEGKGGKSYKVVIQPIKGFDAKPQKKLENELAVYQGIVVYKIHGSFVDTKEDTPSIVQKKKDAVVVTEEDYIEFLLTVMKPKAGIPQLIKAKLVGSTVLFLGYSLEDWDFRTLFKGLIEVLPDRDQLRSYAIQHKAPDFWVDFWAKKNVRIRNVDLYEFAKDLRQRLGIKIEEDLQAHHGEE
jgi:hypothetical protein